MTRHKTKIKVTLVKNLEIETGSNPEDITVKAFKGILADELNCQPEEIRDYSISEIKQFQE